MEQDSPSTTPPLSYSKNGLICKKCRIGNMLPAIQEGEPEYTDNFICQNCQHRDTIPTKDIILNQIITGISGFSVSIYLFITHLSGLFSGLQHDKMQNAFKDSGLMIVAFIFLSGFCYILFRAYAGIKYRAEYLPPKLPKK